MGPGLAYGEGPRLAVGYYFSPMTSGLSEGGAHEPGLLLPRFSGGGQRRGWWSTRAGATTASLTGKS